VDISVVLIAITVAALVVLLFAWRVYNRLVAMRNNVHNAWSDVGVQLRFRHDLVPDLVESVKGYISHERETLESVALARSAAMTSHTDIAIRAVTELALSSALGSLFAKAELYPDLKASRNFLRLHEQLTTTENRIAFARQHYNETARQFNTLIAEFPWNLVAGVLRYSPEQMFGVESQDRTAVEMPT
jgi:LemA protein